MAIDCKSLMIGDWVYFKTNKVYAKITEIYFTLDVEHKYMVSLNSCGNRYCVSINEIEPIPLTPKILKKNGFENIGDDTYQLEEKPCWFWVDFFKHTYGCEHDTSTYEYEDDEHRLKLYGIPSVHELQHALRLCGIEKEIAIK